MFIQSHINISSGLEVDGKWIKEKRINGDDGDSRRTQNISPIISLPFLSIILT